VPGHGLGYGLLRYLSPAAEIAEALRRQPQAEISFNYLGQLDQALDEGSPFVAAVESSGRDSGRGGRREHVFEVNCSVLGGRLQVSWRYRPGLSSETTVLSLSDTYTAVLLQLIQHCQSPAAGGWTPSDFPLMRIDAKTLNGLVEKAPGLEDLYPLTPLQEGMLFHSLHAPESGVYVQQCAATFEGDLDYDLLRRAWEGAAERHTVLRTAFFWQGLEASCQGVFERVELCFETLDWRSLEAAEQDLRLRAWLADDRRRGFDLTSPPLMRWTLLRWSEKRHHLVWSYHHLLFDGWSVSLLLKEIFAAYGRLSAGQAPDLGVARPYGDYVAWLAGQDPAQAEDYWRRTFGDLTAPTPLRVEFKSARP